MSEKSIIETVNINGELGINGDKWMTEKTRSSPHTITLPSTCTQLFQQLSIDLITNLPPSHGYDSLMVVVDVKILFPYRSILLIIHSHCFLTWRGSVCFLNTAYLLVCSSSTFSLVSLSLDDPIS